MQQQRYAAIVPIPIAHLARGLTGFIECIQLFQIDLALTLRAQSACGSPASGRFARGRLHKNA